MTRHNGTGLWTTACLAALCAAVPLKAGAVSVLDAPALGLPIVPIVLERPAPRFDLDIGPAFPDRFGGSDNAVAPPGDCGGIGGAGIHYVDLPANVLDAPLGASADTGVGSDSVESLRFVVRRTADGGVPRDTLDAVGLGTLGTTVDPADALLSSGAAPAGPGLIEVDPAAHLDHRAIPLFPRAFGAGTRTADAEASIVPVAMVGADATDAVLAFAEVPTGRTSEDVGGADVALDTVELLDGADEGSVWLYPAVSPGYLQELDMKGTITFTSFRAPVSMVALDCDTGVGSDAVALDDDTPLVPEPSLDLVSTDSAVFAPPVTRRSVPARSRLVPVAQSRSSGGGGGPLFFGGGGGSSDDDSSDTTTRTTTTTTSANNPPADPCCSSGPPIEPPIVTPLPLAGVLYGSLLVGAGALALRRRRITA